MTAELPLANAGFSYSSDPNTGMHRTGADAQAIECGGVDIVNVATTGVSVTGDISATGVIKQAGFALIPIGLGPLPWSRTAAPPGWVLCNGEPLSRTTYADLWAVAQAEIALSNALYTNGNGTTTFTVADMCGRLPAGADNIGGIVRKNRLTSATITPDATAYGASGGVQTVTIAQANLPAATLTTTINDPGHPHIFGQTVRLFGSAQTGGTLVVAQFNNGTDGSVTIASNTTGITASTALGGSGTATTNVQPTIITNYIIYAGA